MWRVAAFPKAASTLVKPIRFWPGETRHLSGEMTEPGRKLNRETTSPSDSHQYCGSCYDLFAAFSCGGFPLLDSLRMDSAAARATGSATPVTLRDLRVRI